MNKRTLVIAGKNNIAVNIMRYVSNLYGNELEVLAVCNKTDNGEDGWQKSYLRFAQMNHIKVCNLEDVYAIENMVFLSLEFDRIIRPALFKSKELYNIHFSLLPAYKGMYTSPLPILKGETHSGVTLHRIDSGIDTGDIVDQIQFRLENSETGETLYYKYIRNGTELIKKWIEKLLFHGDNIISIPQKPMGSSYYPKGYIDYSHLKVNLNVTAVDLERQVRAFSFRPYQLANINGRDIIEARITNIRSKHTPGTVLFENEGGCMISTIDYNVFLAYDRFEELIGACQSGDEGIVKEISSLADYNRCRTECGWTALIVATYCGQRNVVEYLLSIGANIFDTNYNGTNLLMYAKEVYVKTGNSGLFDLFLELGVDPEQEDDYGKSVLDYCHEAELSDLLTKCQA